MSVHGFRAFWRVQSRFSHSLVADYLHLCLDPAPFSPHRVQVQSSEDLPMDRSTVTETPTCWERSRVRRGKKGSSLPHEALAVAEILRFGRLLLIEEDLPPPKVEHCALKIAHNLNDSIAIPEDVKKKRLTRRK